MGRFVLLSVEPVSGALDYRIIGALGREASVAKRKSWWFASTRRTGRRPGRASGSGNEQQRSSSAPKGGSPGSWRRSGRRRQGGRRSIEKTQRGPQNWRLSRTYVLFDQ